MSKNEEKLVEVVEEPVRDEPTAKFLHKLAENGKERGLPECLTAQYEKNAWDNLKTDVPRFNCGKCGCPPPPPIDSLAKTSPTKTCSNCGKTNEKPIGLQSEIVEMQKKEEILKKHEEKKAQKRPAAPEGDDSKDSDDDDVFVVVKAPTPIPAPAPVVVAERPPPPRQMPRKVAPQVTRMERERARMARELAIQQHQQNQKNNNNSQNSSSSSAKKPKLETTKEPEFLEQLFGIGAKKA